MADFTGQNIQDTYQRVVQTENGAFADGTGSALDIICTKHDTRGWNYGYSYYENLLKDCLPNNWNDNKFDMIYDCAKENLGLHLRR